MKKVFYLIVLMVMVMSLQAAQAEASEFWGDICLSANSSLTDDTFDLRLGLTYVGGGHLALHGISIRNQGLGSAINGNAEIRSDGSIVMTLVNARKNDVELWTTTFYIQDLSYHSIKEIKVFGVSGITHDYDHGVVTFTQCE